MTLRDFSATLDLRRVADGIAWSVRLSNMLVSGRIKRDREERYASQLGQTIRINRSDLDRIRRDSIPALTDEMSVRAAGVSSDTCVPVRRGQVGVTGWCTGALP